MIKELRTKFVIITVVLLVIVFSVFTLLISLYDDYWNSREVLELVQWAADSGLFESGDGAASSETRDGDSAASSETRDEDGPASSVIRDGERTASSETRDGNGPASSGFREGGSSVADESSSIVGVITDSSGRILSIQTSGNYPAPKIDDTLARSILQQDSGQWKYGSYIYTIRRQKDGGALIVLIDTSLPGKPLWQIVGTVLLLLFGIALLTGIAFALSRFVTDPAKRALEREKRFVSDASHELKTPLGAISINAQALERDGSENIHIQNIISEAKRMSRLVERLLTLSRLEESAPAHSRPFSISDAVEEIALTYESVAYDKQQDYQYEITPGLSLSGDQDECKQLAAILIDNAIRHTPVLGQINISLKQIQRHILFEVKNTGKGIPKESLPFIFDRFYSVDPSEKKESFGLGLSIAKAITQRMNGDITATSTEDGTTCFSVVWQRRA